jgi:rubredoxin
VNRYIDCIKQFANHIDDKMMSRQTLAAILAISLAIATTNAFAPSHTRAQLPCRTSFSPRMSEIEEAPSATVEDSSAEEEELDPAQKLALEKQRRADELRSQEVFMKRSTGIHKCSNCDWEYDPAKGDSFLIGGMIKPGTAYEELPSNWRCPTCRASKDSFIEVVEEIPGFEVSLRVKSVCGNGSFRLTKIVV